MKPPKAAYEVTIQIGAEDFERLVLRLRDELLRWETDGDVREAIWGGAGTHGQIDVERRDVTPEQYRDELSEWLLKEQAEQA